jgi:hypothetical protein
MESQAQHLLAVGRYLVDVRALSRAAHRCDPALCRDSGSCCAAYDVWVGDEERARLLGRLPEAARYATHLREGGAFRRLGPDAHAVQKRPDGLCVFAYRAPDGRVLCSLHSAALAAGLGPERLKPHSCVLWPLCVSSSRPPVISVHGDAFRFPCTRRRRGPATIDGGIAGVMRAAFGGEFLSALADAAPGSLARAGGAGAPTPG